MNSATPSTGSRAGNKADEPSVSETIGHEEEFQLASKDEGKVQGMQVSGNLIVVSGPSGVGKGTLVAKLMERIPRLVKSVSVTTRTMRPHEKEGVDYFFTTPENFDKMQENGHFMEWAEFAGNLYGTPSAWVTEKIAEGFDVILEIEVQGAKQIMQAFPDAVLLFLSPPSLEELRNRLKGRGTEIEPKLTLRLFKARQELRDRKYFHYEVVNDNIEDAVNNLTHIVYAERCRIRKNEASGSSHEHD